MRWRKWDRLTDDCTGFILTYETILLKQGDKCITWIEAHEVY